MPMKCCNCSTLGADAKQVESLPINLIEGQCNLCYPISPRVHKTLPPTPTSLMSVRIFSCYPVVKMSEEKISDPKAADETGFQRISPELVKRKPWWKLGGKDYSFVSVNSGYTRAPISTSSSDTKLDFTESPLVGHHVYENEDTKEIYKPIEGYEGSHRFDPKLKWDPAEEKALVKIVRFNFLCGASFQADKICSLIGVLHYQLALCSLLCNLTAATLPKLFRILCYVNNYTLILNFRITD
jgi:hypothetical protein